MIRVVANPWISSPPRKKSARSTSSVVSEVISVRDRVWFSERLTIDSEVPRRIRRKFSRIRSKDNDGVVERIADDRENRGKHGQIEIEPENREDAEGDHHVVEQGRDRAGGELPFETGNMT